MMPETVDPRVMSLNEVVERLKQQLTPKEIERMESAARQARENPEAFAFYTHYHITNLTHMCNVMSDALANAGLIVKMPVEVINRNNYDA
jgi:hypothetical protein